ncbi:MAG TPA: MurT ligase domain-containing protein [Candidatus Saccharimonadales bacterium]|nr:MurT ligase domain-containing protein [Candidatus Saccharimonadales bacterium]
MDLSHKLALTAGRLVKKAARLRGGGSALPGLVIEKLHPDFLKHSLTSLPRGVVVVTGTNGKTTTTKMVAQLLTAQGLRVFTNPTGSNFTRGVAAALLDQVDPETGRLDADIAVLELDEAHAVHFIHQVKPKYSLILNVLRDQLDRFGEIDHTAKLLAKVVESTESGVVLNREDPLVLKLKGNVADNVKLQYFGLNPDLKDQFPSDQSMRGNYQSETPDKLPPLHRKDTILDSLDGHRVVFAFGSKPQPTVTLKLDGLYNVLNAAAALGLVRLILGDETDDAKLLSELTEVKPAFGRGEAVELNDGKLEIVLVKNPSGFRLSLKSYRDSPAATMICVNDNYADGRDMSWLWDVDFDQFADPDKVGVMTVGGIRAYDMALRLQYDGVLVGHVETDLAKALRQFLTDTTGPRRIYTTYTAMLELRRILAKSHKLEAIG